jgi:hypothetical protein
VAERHRAAASPSPEKRQLTNQEATMSRLTRALVIGVALAAMNLAGATAVAQAHANDDPSNRHRALGRLEFLAAAHHAVASQEQNPTNAVEQFRRGERASQEQNPTNAVEQFRRGERASQEQTTTDTAMQAGLAQERYYSTWGYADTPAPVEPSEQPDWLVPAIGVLAAVLALSTGLAVLAARRAGRRLRAGQAA